MNDLTSRQQEVLDFLVAYHEQHGFAPSRKDIADEFGFDSVNASNDHLIALERKGYIQIASGVARGIRIVK